MYKEGYFINMLKLERQFSPFWYNFSLASHFPGYTEALLSHLAKARKENTAKRINFHKFISGILVFL